VRTTAAWHPETVPSTGPTLPPGPASAGDAQQAIVAAIQEHVGAIELPAWPVYGLAVEDERGWLSGGGESSESGVDELRVSYRAPGEAERMTVHTQRRGTPTVDLGRLLSWVQFGDDDDYPVRRRGQPLGVERTLTETPSDTDAEVNGMTVAATVWRTHTASAWRLQTGQVTVSVAARGVPLNALNLIEITDLLPYQQRRATIVTAYLASRHEGKGAQA